MSSPVVHYKAILAYDGTNFAGFQKQAKVRTVQSEIENALRALGWAERSLQAAGRTDAGVHATGQVIAFAINWKQSISRLLSAINAHLPEDIAVHHLEITHSDFRPRQDARARLYRYTIFSHPVRIPLLERYAWRVWRDLDFDLLVQAAELLIGSHDFGAFGTAPKPGGTTVRQVFASSWKRETIEFNSDLKYVYEIEANAFLFHMVRRIVQLQVDIAQGKQPVESILKYLTNKNSPPVMGLAPPHGLNLHAVRYSDPEL